MLGKRVPGHFDEDQYAICWIVDFPMYEMGEESGQLEFYCLSRHFSFAIQL